MRLTVAERFQTALFVSAALHATLLLGVQFQTPKLNFKQPTSLNVVLVNSKTATRPDDPQALAQANLDGGGNTDRERAAKSPMPIENANGTDMPLDPPAASERKPRAVKPTKRTPTATTPEQPRAATETPPPTPAIEAQHSLPPSPAETQTTPPPAPEHVAETPAEVPPEPTPQMQALAEAEARANERAAALEREARELMTQLQAQEEVPEPATTISVAPNYRPRPSPERSDSESAPSPAPKAATSSARVVKVEPRQVVLNTPTITAPPKTEMPRSESKPLPAPAPERAGAQVLQRAHEPDAPEEKTPAKLQPTLTLKQPPSPTPPEPQKPAQVTPPPREVAAIEPAPPTPAPAREVQVVKLEPKPEAKPEPAREVTPIAKVERVEPTPAPQSEPTKVQVPNAAELMRRSSEIARLEAQISKDWDQYQKRPRRKFIGARTSEYRYARYIEEWRTKVERIGNMNYPEAARQRQIHGSLQLTVAIKADGAVESVEINRSSGQKLLDAAAIRIVELAAPYSHFTADISKDTDILHITRTWTFTRADQLISE